MSMLPPEAGVPMPTTADDDQIPLWVIAAVVVVLLAMVGVGFVLLRPSSSSSTTVQAPTYPESWDKRVAPVAKIVERKRDLRFQHPVEVRFLSDKEFEKTLAEETDDPDAAERKEIEQFTGLLRAMGLVSGDVDLRAATRTATRSAALAYYSYQDEAITVRGRKITPAIRSTLVHELTHVLQDQHFGVGDRIEELEDVPDNEPSSNEASVLRAILEGDAERVEALYRESLSAREQAALDGERSERDSRIDRELSKVPEIVVTLLGSPYALGGGLVQAAAVDGGNSTIDDLLREPPVSDNVLLDPLRELAGESAYSEVKIPETRDGEKEFTSGELGALTWYLMLSERLPLSDALEAADAWGGDAFVAYESDGVSCVRATIRADSASGARTLASALRRWGASDPQAKTGGRTVDFESCDPGKAAEAGRDASMEAVRYVSTRTYLGVGFMRNEVSLVPAACMADRLMGTYSVENLNDPTFGANDPTVQARVRQIASTCL